MAVSSQGRGRLEKCNKELVKLSYSPRRSMHRC
jgi:hypothetical protein